MICPMEPPSCPTGISSLKEGVDKLAGGYSGDEGAAAGRRSWRKARIS